MANGIASIAQALSQKSQTLGQNNQLGGGLGAAKQELAAGMQDDNSVKTPEINAQEMDRIRAVVMMLIDFFNIIAEEHQQLMGGQSALNMGEEAPLEETQHSQ